MAKRIAVVKVKTLTEKVIKVEAEELHNKLADKLAKEKVKTLVKKLNRTRAGPALLYTLGR